MCYLGGMETWQETIKRCLTSHGVSHGDFADKAGVARETLSRWLNNKNARPKRENIQKMADTLQEITKGKDFDAVKFVEGFYQFGSLQDESLLAAEESGQSDLRPDPNDFTYIPKVEAVLSGGNGSWITSPQIQNYYAFRIEWVKQKGPVDSMVLMEVQGDSMLPTIRDGDRVLINKNETRPLDGKIFAVALGESILIKRMIIKPDAFVLVSDNPDQERHSPIIIKKEEIESKGVRFLGKVIWLGREL